MLSIKDEGTSREIFKAYYFVQGFRDKLKTSLVHDSATAKRSSTKILVGLAAAFGFRLFITDVCQAYLQSTDELLCDVYIEPGKDFEPGSQHICKLLRALYGLSDSGDYWGHTFSRHISEYLGMTPTTADAAFFFKTVNQKF